MTEKDNTCSYGLAWVGECQNQSPCEEHKDLKCGSCGAPATHQCDSTGQFVCGFDLCDNCEHAIFPDGTNGGIGFNAQELPKELKSRHVKKDEQIYKMWLRRKGKNDVYTEYGKTMLFKQL
jgi:hypothetical protein